MKAFGLKKHSVGSYQRWTDETDGIREAAHNHFSSFGLKLRAEDRWSRRLMWAEENKSSVLKYIETPVSPCDNNKITAKMLIKES